MTSLSTPLVAPHDAAAPLPKSPTDVARSHLRATLAITSIVALTLAAGLPGLGAWCRLTPDSFTYLDAARCLRETGGYSPFRMIAPPGLPTLLAPLLGFGDLPLLAVRLFNLACWIASSVLTYLLFRRQIGTAGAWLAAALTATSPALAAQSTMLLSEPAFMPLALGGLVLMELWRVPGTSRWAIPIAVGLLCVAAAFVRTMGIILAPILAVAILARLGPRFPYRALQAALFASVVALPLVAWELRQSGYPSNNSYGRAWLTARPRENTDATGWGLQVERLSRFGPMRLRDIKAALVPPLLGWRASQGRIATIANWLIGAAIILLTLWRCWRVRSPIDFFALATLGMLCLWPYDEGPRMVVPMLPFFFAYLIWAAQNAQRALAARPRASKFVTFALAGILVAHLCELGLAAPALARQREKADDRVAAMQRIGEWQEANLPAGAPLACVTRLRDDAKTILIGGSYLARRHIVQTLTELHPLTDDALIPEVRFCFVRAELLGHAIMPSGWSSMGRVEGFEVYSATGHRDNSP